MAQENPVFIKTGDLITLFSEEGEEDGFVSCGGASDDQVIVKAAKDKDVVFKILPMMQFAEGGSNAPDAAAGSQGGGGADSMREASLREALHAQLDGKPIIFGQIVQLLHVRTQRFVAGKDDSGGQELALVKEGSRACWFMVVPHGSGDRDEAIAEGEKVLSNSKIRLEHVQSGCVLHQSDQLNNRSQCLVDLRSPGSATGWLVRHSDVGGGMRAAIKHGGFVRFFDPQSGYLRSADLALLIPDPKSSVVAANLPFLKAKHYGAQNNERVGSYHTIFEVLEESGPNPNVPEQEILWGRRCRLRLFGTDYFVTLRPREDAAPQQHPGLSDSSAPSGVPVLEVTPPEGASDPDTEISDVDVYQLGLTDDTTSELTLFMFTPVKREGEEIAYGSEALIQSASVHHWVHCSDDFAYSTGKKGAQETEVFCSKRFSYRDAFQLRPVPRYQIDDFAYASDRARSLARYVDLVESGSRVDKRTKTAAVDTLSDCIRFVTASDVQDVMKREGAPIATHQDLLGRKDVLTVLTRVAAIGDKQDAKITTLAYTLLRHVVRDHPRNGAVLHSVYKLPVFDETFDLEKVDYYKGIPIAKMIVEMYRGNAELTYRLDETVVRDVFNVLKTTFDPQYIELFRTWCYFRGAVVHNNQRMIAHALLEHADTVVMRTRAKGSQVQIKSMSREWVQILEFTAPRRFPEEEVNYQLAMLSLYSDLCVGRNTTCINILTSTNIGMSYEEAFVCLKTNGLEPRFRAAYCDILVHLFVDIFPHSPHGTAFKRVWYSSKTDKLLGKESTGTITSSGIHHGHGHHHEASLDTARQQLAEVNMDLEQGTNTQTKFPNPNNLTEFLLDYIFDQYNTRLDSTQQASRQPHFLLRVMVLLRKSFEFNFFKKMESHVMTRIREILSIAEDSDHNGQRRQLDSEHRALLVSIKREALRIVDRYVDLLESSLFGSYLSKMARDVLDRPTYITNRTGENDAKAELARTLIALSRPQNEGRETGDPLLEELAGGNTNSGATGDVGEGDSDMLEFTASHEATRGLVPILLSQLHHEDAAVTQHSLDLIQRAMRLQNKSASLVKALSRVQLLTRSKDKDYHGQVLNRTQQMLALASAELNAKKLEELVAIIDELATACDESDDPNADVNITNQRMFYNTGLHEDILNIVQRPIEADKSVGPKGRSAVLCACYGFLRAFVRLNTPNQHVLYEQMDFMLSQMLLYAKDGDVPRAIAGCLVEIFRDNKALCGLITEQHLRPFITMMFEHKKDPVYLALFRTIIKPCGAVIKANQNLVLRLLVARPETKSLVRADIETAKPDEKAAKKTDSQESDSDSDSDSESDSEKETTTQEKKPEGEKKDAAPADDKGKGKETPKVGDASKEMIRRVMTKAKSVGKGKKRMERQDSAAVLIPGGKDGRSGKMGKTATEEFRVGFISLIALCTEDRNFFTERNCQKLFSVDEAIAAASAAKDKSFLIVGSYAYFVDEVYLNTETSSVDTGGSSVLLLQFNARLWSLLGAILSMMNQVIDAGKLKDAIIDDSLVRCVYDLFVPFIQHLYAKAFVLRQATADQLETSNKILDAIYLLRARMNARQDRTRRWQCTAAVKVMVAQGLVGADHQQKLDKICKSQVSNVAATDVDQNTLASASHTRKSIETRVFLRRVRKLICRAIAKEYLMEDITTVQEEATQKHDRALALEGDESFRDYVRILVRELAQSRRISSSALGDDERVFEDDVKLRLHALRLLREYIEFDGQVAKNITIPRHGRQQKLATLETPVAIATLLSWEHSKLVGEALDTLASMLAVDPSSGGESHRGLAQVLTRFLTSQGSAAFFRDLTALMDQSKSVIRDFRRRFFASPAVAYYAREAALHDAVPIAIDAGADLVKQLELLVELPPDLRVQSACRVIELLSNDRDSGALFRALMVSDATDMVRELAQYAKAYETSISKGNASLAEQLFATLAAAVRGNANNAHAVVNAQILHAANRLLLHVFEHGYTEGEDPEIVGHLVKLKGSIIDFLSALAECGDERVMASIISQVSSKGFEETTRLLAPDSDPYNLIPPSDATVALASRAFRLVKLLVDSDKEHTKSYRDSLDVCDKHTRSRIGRIEVVTSQNTLETIYFPIPQDFRRQPKLRRRFFGSWSNVVAFERDTNLDALNQKAEALLNKQLEVALVNDDINWNRAGDKLDGFVRFSEKALLRREQAKSSSHTWFGKKMIHGWPIFWNLSFFVAMAFNLILLFSDGTAASTVGHESIDYTLQALGWLQVLLSFLVCVSHFMRRAIYINGKAWLSKLDPRECHMLRPWKEIKEQKLRPLYKVELFYWIRSLFHVVFDPLSFFYLCYFASALVGALSAPLRYFFAFQIFQVVVRSQYLRGVMIALRTNAASLMLMVLLMVDMQYVFAIIAYNFFPNYFQPGYGSAQYCDSLIQCLLTLLYFGMPTSGGLTQFLPSYWVDPSNGSVPSQSYAMVIYIFFYFSITGPILLNVTFALIVDTFGQLRETRKEAKDNLGTTCFVCSLERDAFQQRAKDFNVHLDKEHNRLHYLYFFAYLKDLSLRGLPRSDLEMELTRRIFNREFLKFFPVGRALSLETENDEEGFNIRLITKVERLERQLESNNQLTERLVKGAQESHRQELRALKNELLELRRLVDPNAGNSPATTPRTGKVMRRETTLEKPKRSKKE